MSAVTNPESIPPTAPLIAPVRGAPERRRRPRVTVAAVSRGPGLISLNHGSTFLVAGQDGSIRSQDNDGQGCYSDDTRFVSHHELRLNGRPLVCLSSSRLSFRRARWTLTRPEDGVNPTVPGRVTVSLERLVSDRRIHEDIVVRCYGGEPLSLLLSLGLESDFADIFEVRTERWQRRTGLATVWTAPNRLDTRYRRGGFSRRCLVRMAPRSRPVTYANGALRFPIDLGPGGEWRVCLQYDLIIAAGVRPAMAPCPVRTPVVDRAERLRRRWHHTVARAWPSDLRLLHAFDQAVDDFAALRLYDHDFSQDVWLPAAGIPWFVAVFGRDSLLASLQALPAHPLFAVGTLQKLAQWQATEDDPVRDAEPGKICHEMRVGEWAHFRTIPHSPYYGTADATPLYLLLLAETWRWLGDAPALERFRGTATRCLAWIDEHGDRDGDGLQEYAPRSPQGYRNQCWRDAEDGVLDEAGGFPQHPIGTCEMQAYVYAAWLRCAGLFAAWGDEATAARLRRQAVELRRRFLEAFWMEDSGELAFALDGRKQPIRTATSNPGHCLWLGILDGRRAGLVADRLMRPDLFTGWGLRTLSSAHPAYDPHSYQRGSVWPHDTMIAAAGLRRIGRLEDCWRLIDGLLGAVSALERVQMPELFAGLPRASLDAPIPYERANVPQAWAAGAVFHAVRVLLGLEPDVPGGTLYIDPALPPWCPELRLENIRVGTQRVTVLAERNPDGSSSAAVESAGPLRVVQGAPPWLAPPG